MSPYHVNLLIGELQEIHVFQNGKHLLGAGLLVILPHQIPVIDVKAYQLAQLFRSGHGILGSLHRRSCRKAAGACLYDTAVLQIFVLNFALLKQHVRAGLSREGKASVIVLVQRYKRHGCSRVVCHLRRQRRYMILPQGFQQKLSEIVIAHLAVHACLKSVSCRADCYICGRAACVTNVASFFLAGKKINYHLSNCNKIHTFSYLSHPCILRTSLKPLILKS